MRLRLVRTTRGEHSKRGYLYIQIIEYKVCVFRNTYVLQWRVL